MREPPIKVDDDIFRYVAYYVWSDLVEHHPNTIHPYEWTIDGYYETDEGVTQYEFVPLTIVRRWLEEDY